MNNFERAEQMVKNLKSNKEALENLPSLLSNIKSEVYITQKAMNQLSEKDRNIINKLCIEKKPVEEVAKEMKITPRMIHYIKKEALQNLEKILFGQATK